MAAEAHIRLARALGGDHLYLCSYCEQNPGFKMLLGHDGPPVSLYTEHLLTGEALARCPRRTILLAPEADQRELYQYTEVYGPAYEDGFLLVAGGIADQPARYVELVQLCRNLQRRVDGKYLEIKQKELETDGG